MPAGTNVSIATNTALDANSGYIALGTLSGSGQLTSSAPTATTGTLPNPGTVGLGPNNANFTFNGIVSAPNPQNLNLAKIGTGTLTLTNGALSPVTVSQGVVVINGVSMNSMNAFAGGTFSPTSGTIGTLSVTGGTVKAGAGPIVVNTLDVSTPQGGVINTRALPSP